MGRVGTGAEKEGRNVSEELFAYRVWPDGTVQDWDETPYIFMSDDYARMMACDEDHASDLANPKAEPTPS